MTANPIDLVYVDGVAVSKSDVRAFEKQYVRKDMADANAARSTILAGQFGGLHLRALSSDFDLDTLDTTTADDGLNCIVSLDGYRFKRVKPLVTRSQRIVTAAGAVTALVSDDIIIIKKTAGAATTVNVDWSIMVRPLTIVDGKGDAATNAITIVPATGKTQYGVANYQVVIDGNGGQVTLTPLSDGSGGF